MKVKLGDMNLITPHQGMIMRFTGLESLTDENLSALAPGQQLYENSHTKSPFQGSVHGISNSTRNSFFSSSRARIMSSEVDEDTLNNVRAGSMDTSAMSTHDEGRQLFPIQSQSNESASSDTLAMSNGTQALTQKQPSLAVICDFMYELLFSIYDNLIQMLKLCLEILKIMILLKMMFTLLMLLMIILGFK